MSKTIDQKVVEMQFDNRQFEKNVSTTMSSVEKLKQSLNFTGASKGLENVTAAAKRVDMSPMASAVETVTARFSALQVMGVTALANITNSAVNAGKRIVSALTIDPVKTGFQEYETQINAVQTILANTSHQGTNLQQVNAALDELNKYADQTIYNFTEMTRNIGTFTAAGVDLDTSVGAIKGIANLAAVSGSTATQASTAMYQLSQALAAGQVTLQDWNSVVNAGMGGKVFQDALINTAEAMGIVVDKSVSFRESISAAGGKKSWLTADVLLNTLNQFTGDLTDAELAAMGFTEAQIKNIQEMAVTANDAATKVKTFTQLWDTLKESAQSGWTETWEILIGDFEEAKELLTDLSELFGGIIGQSADSRNSLLYDTMTSNWKKITDGVTEAGLSVDEFEENISKIGKKQVKNFDEIVKEAGSLEKAFKSGALSSDILEKALLEMTGSTDEISKELTKLSGDYKTNEDILNALTKAGYGLSDTQDLIAKSAAGEKIALNDLTDAQLLSLGYTAEQVQRIRELSTLYDLASGSLNKFMDDVTVSMGRELLIDVLRSGLYSLIDVFGAVGKAWRQVFPPTTSEQLYSVIQSIKDFVTSLEPSEATLSKIQRTFAGLFSILSIGAQIISAFVRAVGSLLGNFDGLGGGILDVTATIGDWLVSLSNATKQSGTFNTIFQTIAKSVQFVIDVFKQFISIINEKFVAPGIELISAALDNISRRMTQVEDAATVMESGVSSAIGAMGDALNKSNFLQMLQAIWNTVKAVGSGLANVFGAFASVITENLATANFTGILDFFNTLIAGGIGVAIYNFVNGLGDLFDSVGSLQENLMGILDGVRGTFEAYQSNLKASVLIKIAAAIAIMAASLLIISTIDSEKLNAALGAMTVLFVGLIGAMSIFGKLGGALTGVFKASVLMTSMSIAVLILAGALKTLASIDLEGILTGLVGIGGLTAVLILATKAMNSGTKTIIKGATRMIIFAAALKILASVVKDLSSLSWNELAKGLVGVSVLMAAVSAFLNTAKFSGKSITTATGIVILAAAMNVLAIACKSFAQLEWGEIGKGLTAIGALLLEIALFTNLTGNAKHVISSATSLMIIAATMLIFAESTKRFADMSWDDLTRGLIGMAGALAAVTVALNFMPKNMIGLGTGLVIVSSSLLIMSSALKNMGGMSWEEITKGLITLGGAMAILAVGLYAMTGTLAGSAALLVSAAALAIMAPVLKLLGGMDWTSIAKGLVALAGAFAVLGVAGLVLGPLVPSILGLAGAFALIGLSIVGIGAGFLAAGAGISALAVGIAALATALTGGATAIAAGLAVIIGTIVALIPSIIEMIGVGLIKVCDVIIDGAPAIAEAIMALVVAALDILTKSLPMLVDGLLAVVVDLLEMFVQYTPQIVDAIIDFLIVLIDSVAARLPELIVAAVDLIMAFFTGVIDALKGIDVKTLVAGLAGVGLMAAIMAALSAVEALIPGAMVGVLGMGAVIAELAIVLAAIGALAQIPGLNWLINEGATLMQSIGTAIGSLIGGIVGGFMSGVSSQFPQIGADLSAFMVNLMPFIMGAKLIDSTLLDGIGALAETILILTGASILNGIASWLTGGSSLTQFALELVPFGLGMKAFSVAISGMDAQLVANAATAGKALAEMATTIPNSGGLVSFFAGDNSMARFGIELVAFGDAMKGFADSIAGVDTELVTNAATAGKSLTELAATVPNSGGLVSFFAGDNDMATFGLQLVAFGAAMKLFAMQVAGIDPEVVTNAANAGKAMVELANTIPNTGGLISFFAGDNDMATFGEDLEAFGGHFAAYAESIANVKPEVVTASANAAAALVQLSDSLGTNKWFVDEVTLDEFGEQLATFGEKFAAFYGKISGIDTGTLSGVIGEVDRLLSIAKGMTGVDFSGMTGFSTGLVSMANAGIEEFITAFTNANARFETAAANMITAFVTSVNAKKVNLNTAFTFMFNELITLTNNKRPELALAAGNMIMGITDAIAQKRVVVLNAFRNLAIQGANTIRGYYETYKGVGKALAEGVAAGIDENTFMVIAKAKAMSIKAYEAAKAELQVASPSKLFMQLGRYVVLGFTNALDQGAYNAEASAADMAGAAVEGTKNVISRLAEAIDTGIDVQPTIRPVLDLSAVEEGTGRLSTLFNRNQAMTISSGLARRNQPQDQNGTETPKTGNTYTFTQNNYSPKALSRVDIYRQTKNQFSAFERVSKA